MKLTFLCLLALLATMQSVAAFGGGGGGGGGNFGGGGGGGGGGGNLDRGDDDDEEETEPWSATCNEELLKQMVKEFFDLDSNRNGVLDPEDDLGDLEKDLCCNYYVDGEATFGEYLHHRVIELGVDLTDETLRGISTRFHMRDLNGDGFIGANDMKAELENDEDQEAIGMLQAMDTNGDGRISFCECIHFGPIHP